MLTAGLPAVRCASRRCTWRSTRSSAASRAARAASSRRACAAPLLPLRMAVQPFVDRAVQRNLAKALEIARREDAPLTTPQE